MLKANQQLYCVTTYWGGYSHFCTK